jgi:GT2 family glycosyltransferase
MTKALPKVIGFIVPCFNQGRFLAECIGSLYRQSYPHWRVVVIDDASTDGESPGLCKAVASDKVEVFLLGKNVGRALVRNEGLRRLGVVDYVITIDCDDHLSSTFLEKLLNALEASPKAGFAYGVLHPFGEGDAKPRSGAFPDREWVRESMYFENLIPGTSALFRYDCLRQTEGWRADFTDCGGEDYDLWLQAVEAGWEPLWVRDADYFYRHHVDSFMAKAGRDNGLRIELNILKHHFGEIEKTVGIEPYLNLRLLPEIYGSLRTGDMARVSSLALPLLKISPSKFLYAAARYYWGRLRLRLAGETRTAVGR